MKKLFTIPNFLSLIRLIFIPILIIFILNIKNSSFPIFIVFCFVAFFLDFLDGFFARKLKQESEFGKILDPVADKLLVLGLLVALLIKTDFPHWLAIIIFARDFFILIASLLLLKKKGIIKSSLIIGKVTFALLSLLIFFYLIDLHDGFDFCIIKNFLIPLCFSFVFLSGIEYWMVFRSERI